MIDVNQRYLRDILKQPGRIVAVYPPPSNQNRLRGDAKFTWSPSVDLASMQRVTVTEYHNLNPSTVKMAVAIEGAWEVLTATDHKIPVISVQVAKDIWYNTGDKALIPWTGNSCKSLALLAKRVFIVGETDPVTIKRLLFHNARLSKSAAKAHIICFPTLTSDAEFVGGCVPWADIFHAYSNGTMVKGAEWLTSLDSVEKYSIGDKFLFSATVYLPRSISSSMRMHLVTLIEKFGGKVTEGEIRMCSEASIITIINPLTFYMDYSSECVEFIETKSNILPVRLGWFSTVLNQGHVSSLAGAIYEQPRPTSFSDKSLEQVKGHHLCMQLSVQDDIDTAISLAAKAQLNVTEHAERATYIVCNPVTGRVVEPNMRTIDCLKQWVTDGKPHEHCPETHIPIFVPLHAQTLFGGERFLLFVGQDNERLAKIIQLLSGTICTSVLPGMSYWILWEPGVGNVGLLNHLAALTDDAKLAPPPPIFRLSLVLDAIRFGLPLSLQQNLVQNLGELSLSVPVVQTGLLSAPKETHGRSEEKEEQETTTPLTGNKLSRESLPNHSKRKLLPKYSASVKRARNLKTKYTKLRKTSTVTQTIKRVSKRVLKRNSIANCCSQITSHASSEEVSEPTCAQIPSVLVAYQFEESPGFEEICIGEDGDMEVVNLSSLLEENASAGLQLSPSLNKSFLRVTLLKEIASFAGMLGLWAEQDVSKAVSLIRFPELGSTFSRGVAELRRDWEDSTNSAIMTGHFSGLSQLQPESFFSDARAKIFHFLRDCGFEAILVKRENTLQFGVSNGHFSNVVAILLKSDTSGSYKLIVDQILLDAMEKLSLLKSKYLPFSAVLVCSTGQWSHCPCTELKFIGGNEPLTVQTLQGFRKEQIGALFTCNANTGELTVSSGVPDGPHQSLGKLGARHFQLSGFLEERDATLTGVHCNFGICCERCKAMMLMQSEFIPGEVVQVGENSSPMVCSRRICCNVDMNGPFFLASRIV